MNLKKLKTAVVTLKNSSFYICKCKSSHFSFLIGDEIRAWLVPDLTETARKEAEHLIEEADTDKVLKISCSY